jgi:hypothetical protein
MRTVRTVSLVRSLPPQPLRAAPRKATSMEAISAACFTIRDCKTRFVPVKFPGES